MGSQSSEMPVLATVRPREKAIFISAAILLFLSLALAYQYSARRDSSDYGQYAIYCPLIVALISGTLILFGLYRSKFSMFDYYALLFSYFFLSLIGLAASFYEPNFCFALMSLAALLSGIAVSSRSLALMSLFNVFIFILLIFNTQGRWTGEPLNFYFIVIAVLLLGYLLISALEKLAKRHQAVCRALAGSKTDGRNRFFEFNKFFELGKLTQGVIHDLINPLTALTLCLDDVNKEVEKKAKAGRRKLVKNLELARNAAGKMENFIQTIHRQASSEEPRADFDASEEVRAMLDLVSHKARQADVEIRLGASAEEAFIINGNPVKFDQIFLNLIVNAIDACAISQKPDGKLVKISLHEFKSSLNILIEDNGIGIKAEYQSMIFKPFFSLKYEHGNIGLGLSSVKKIISEHFFGEIAFYSQEGEGTQFYLQIPKNIS